MPNNIKTFAFLAILLLGASYASALWQGPTQTPPGGNVAAPLNIGNNAQIKEGNLTLNASNSFLNGLLVPYGNVGIGTASPTAKLHLGGTAGTDGIRFPDGTLQTTAGAGAPTGAVLAFNLSSCPSGWSEYTGARGRTIIGTNPDTSNGLSVRTLGATVGEENHTLTVSEIPSHTHGMWGNPHGGSGQGSWQSVTPSQQQQIIAQTTAIGGNQPHNVMQPSIALLYCQKN